MSAKLFLDRLGKLATLQESDNGLIQSIPWSTVSVKRSREILRVGGRPSYVFAINSGWAARYSMRRDGSRRITGFMLPGDFCGIHALTEEAMDHSIVAITDCDVTRVSASLIAEVVAASSTIAKAFWRAKLVEEAIMRMWLLNSHDAETALAHLICELHVRAAAIDAVHNDRFLMPIIQDQLGEALGLSGVHVNRMMKKLRLSGLVDFKGHEVIIPDVTALRTACNFFASYLHLPVPET